MTTPINPAQQKELQDFRASLPDELKAVLDSMIRVRGEEYVHSILGFLKESVDEAINL